MPSVIPSIAPTIVPIVSPTIHPSMIPTLVPSITPVSAPSFYPIQLPTAAPIAGTTTQSPTKSPTKEPIKSQFDEDIHTESFSFDLQLNTLSEETIQEINEDRENQIHQIESSIREAFVSSSILITHETIVVSVTEIDGIPLHQSISEPNILLEDFEYKQQGKILHHRRKSLAAIDLALTIVIYVTPSLETEALRQTNDMEFTPKIQQQLVRMKIFSNSPLSMFFINNCVFGT